MSKNILEDINNSINNNVVFSANIGQPQEPQKANIETKKSVSDNEIKKVIDVSNDNYKYKNGKDKNKNYTITLKIDADIEQYLKNIDKITFIDSIKQGKADSKTTTDYVNELIRADLKKRFNISSKENNPNKWIDAYTEYANTNGIQDK